MFTAEVTRAIGFYVYRLVDPRDGETFYVGKGTGNRCFGHSAGKLPAEENSVTAKLDRIRSIKRAGMDVEVIIHRHGMDEATAFAVEAALMDVFEGLTNAVRGHGADRFGAAPAVDVLRRYQAETASFQHDLLLVSINRNAERRKSYYDAARFAWPISARSASKVHFVLAVRERVVVGVFQPTCWKPATRKNFPEFAEDLPERLAFEGGEAPPGVKELYLNKRLPAELRLSQAGVRFINEKQAARSLAQPPIRTTRGLSWFPFRRGGGL